MAQRALTFDPAALTWLFLTRATYTVPRTSALAVLSASSLFPSLPQGSVSHLLQILMSLPSSPSSRGLLSPPFRKLQYSLL